MSGDFFTRLAVRSIRANVGLRPALGEVDLIAGRPGDLDDEIESPASAPIVVGAPPPRQSLPAPPVVVEVGPTEIRPLEQVDSVVATPSQASAETVRSDPLPASSTPLVVEHVSLTHVERHETSTARHHTQLIEQRSERLVERVVDLRPSAAAAVGVDHLGTRDPTDPSGPRAAPQIEIHIGRLEIGERRRRPTVESARPESRREAPVAPALGLSEYLAARNNR